MPRVFLVGAGPGDPELLTLKAHRLIAQADVVLHDSLVDRRIIAMIRSDALVIDVGKRCGRHSATQTEISALLCRHARGGARRGRGIVVRLKGGDPMVFGRATEEMAALDAAGIAYEVVPGVTAATAAAAALKISLTQRGVARAVHFLTGHGAEGGLPAHDWVALTRSGGTLAIYMGGETAGGTAAHFIEAGMAPGMPAIAIENASLPGSRIRRGTIAALPTIIAEIRASGPVLVLIGEALRERNEDAGCRDHELLAMTRYAAD